MELWYPHAIREELDNGGDFISSPPRGVLHTTEGSSYAGAKGAYKANRSAPHFTCSVEGGVARVWQHIPMNRAARAMQNRKGGVQTNRLTCWQIEVVGFASKPNWVSELVTTVRNLMIWIEQQTGIQPKAPRFYASGEGIVLAHVDSPIRFTHGFWNQYNGWCGHQHVPENDHWDPGACPITALLTRQAPTPENPKPEGAPMANAPFAKILVHPNGGYLEIGEDGGVFAWGEPAAPFYGSLGGIALNQPIVDAEWTPTCEGYYLLGRDGGIFAFGDARHQGNALWAG